MLTRISVFLITLSGLVLEVGLTRIYSASIWYHFAFVAISVALLGWGLGGFTVHLLKQRVRLSMDVAALVTLLYAGTIPLCLWLLVRYPFEMDRLPLYFLAPLLPFFLAGMALSIVFDIHRAVAGTLYFYDLIGAALGAVLVTLLLHLLGGEAALLAATVAPALAALLMSLSPASRAQENKNNASDPGVASRSESGLTPGYSMSRLQREEEGSDSDVGARPSPNPLAKGEGEGHGPPATAGGSDKTRMHPLATASGSVTVLPRVVQVAAI